MMNFETYNLLNDYLNDHLSLAEKSWFEKRLATEPELQKQLEELKIVDNALINYKLEQVQDICANEYRVTKKQTQIRRVAWIASGAIILVGLTYYLLSKSTEKNSTLPLPIDAHTEVIKPKTVEKKQFDKSSTERILQKKTNDHRLEKIAIISQKDSRKTDLTPDEETTAPITKQNTITKPVDRESDISVLDVPLDSCLVKPLTIKTSTTPSCKNENTGSIKLQVNGGFPPYNQQVLDKDKTEMDFNQLTTGEYQVMVSDRNSCKKSTLVSIKEKICPENLKFNLSLDNYFTFEAQKGTLIILEQNGRIYFEQELDEFSTFEWDGKSNDGNLILGLLLFRIEKEGKLSKLGSITILE